MHCSKWKCGGANGGMLCYLDKAKHMATARLQSTGVSDIPTKVTSMQSCRIRSAFTLRPHTAQLRTTHSLPGFPLCPHVATSDFFSPTFLTSRAMQPVKNTDKCSFRFFGCWVRGARAQGQSSPHNVPGNSWAVLRLPSFWTLYFAKTTFCGI